MKLKNDKFLYKTCYILQYTLTHNQLCKLHRNQYIGYHKSQYIQYIHWNNRQSMCLYSYYCTLMHKHHNQRNCLNWCMTMLEYCCLYCYLIDCLKFQTLPQLFLMPITIPRKTALSEQ